MQTLTRSGAGVLVAGADAADPGLPDRLRALLDARRFVVLRGALPRLEDAVALLSRFGPINHAETRKDGAVLVEAARDDEVFRSNHALPLHKDGILTGFDVLFVGIYCVDFREVSGGRTYVSDATMAVEDLPPEHLALLRERGVEGTAVDQTGYYRAEFQGAWHRVQAFKARPGRKPTLHLGLPHAPGEPESWRVRVPDVSAEVSEAVLRSLRTALLDPARTYFHAWEEGDLLLMDNYAVLHGREAFKGRLRRLANIQVLAS
jgi:alpha-ketoglutarate-dependent taurine dioxygenase